MKHLNKLLLALLPAALVLGGCDKELAGTAADQETAQNENTSMVSTIAGSQAGYQDGPARQAKFSGITDVAVADDGTVYIAEPTRIRKLKDSLVSTLAGTGVAGCKDGPGKNAQFGKITGIDVAADGTIYVVDRDNNSIRKVSSGGMVSTLTGGADKQGYQDGPLKTARFTNLLSVAVGAGGVVYIREESNRRKIDAAGMVSTLFKGAGPEPGLPGIYAGAISTSPDGTLFFTNASGSSSREWSVRSLPDMPETFPDAVAVGFGAGGPRDITAENGKIYLITQGNTRIGTPNYPVNYDENTILAGKESVDEVPPTEPEEGPGPDVYFSNLIAIAWYNDALYAADGAKIKKVTLP